MLLRVLPANRAVVPPVGPSARVPLAGQFVPRIMTMRLLRALRVPCMTPSVLNAAKPPKSPSSRQAPDPFTVQTAITPKVLLAVPVLLNLPFLLAAVPSRVLPAALRLSLQAPALLGGDVRNRVLPDRARAVSIPLISAISAVILTAPLIRDAVAANATISAKTKSAAAKKAEEAVLKGAISTMMTTKCITNC